MEGDIIYVVRLFPQKYRHYGIEAENGTVIHFQQASGVVQTSMSEFLGFGRKHVDEMLWDKRLPREQVVSRAKAYVGRTFRSGYHLIKNNCEHFAFYCATGLATSRQVGFTNDDQDIVEKAIDRMAEPWIKFGGFLDRITDAIRYRSW